MLRRGQNWTCSTVYIPAALIRRFNATPQFFNLPPHLGKNRVIGSRGVACSCGVATISCTISRSPDSGRRRTPKRQNRCRSARVFRPPNLINGSTKSGAESVPSGTLGSIQSMRSRSCVLFPNVKESIGTSSTAQAGHEELYIKEVG